jgi:hypothetical protein
LNDQQKDIVLCDDKIIYVNAGPGTGKTRLLVHKLLRYIQISTSKEKIVALSYINTAARELGDRFRDAIFKVRLEKGYDFYTQVIKNELSGASFRRPEGEPMDSGFCKKSGVFVDACKFARSGEWKEHGNVSWSEPNPGRKGISLASSDASAELSLEFYGAFVMLGARLDRNAGKAEVTLDGESRVCDLYYATDDQPVIIVENFALSEGKHTLCVSPLEGNVKIDFAVIPE